MKTKITNKWFLLLLLVNVFLLSPLYSVSAYINGGGSGYVGCGDPSLSQQSNGLCLPNNPNTGGGIAGSQTLAQLILRVINYLLTFAAIFAILMIVIGGFKYIFSNGDSKKAESGLGTLKYAAIGLAVVILSYTIVSIVNHEVTNGGSGFGTFFPGI